MPNTLERLITVYSEMNQVLKDISTDMGVNLFEFGGDQIETWLITIVFLLTVLVFRKDNCVK